MRPQDIIAIKRDGGRLSAEQIAAFVVGICDGSWADYQITALVMAMFTRGLNDDEAEVLVREMLNSGEILDFSEIDAPKADKHSTGGVGDKTSLIIAPVVAACGVAVPMISGRGLGHTGGTLDKLESIPGYNVRLSNKEFHDVIDKCGFAMAGQTEKIAPADRKLYELRNATATVPYIPLIVASIMSKKLAEGLDALVLDVKTGNGAFMQTLEDSTKLAKAMVETGKKFGVNTEAVVSDMSEPLGQYVGNSLEVYECVKILRNEANALMRETIDLSLDLAARMLVLSGTCVHWEKARELAMSKIESGEALETFRRNCELQGGDVAVCDDPNLLLDTSIQSAEVKSDRGGSVEEIDALRIGETVVELGGGRTWADVEIDHSVGFACAVKSGDAVEVGQTLGTIYCFDFHDVELIRERIKNAYRITDESVVRRELIQAVIQ